MCFRPSTVEIDKTCPKCGAKNGPADTMCKERGADLSAGTGAPGVPGAVGAPGAPAAPGTLVPPGAPFKAPGA